MCGGMAITTNNCGTWQSKALFWTDDMYDSLSLVSQAKVCEAEILYILFESYALCPRVCLFNKLCCSGKVLSGTGGDVLVCVSGENVKKPRTKTYVVYCCQGTIGSSHFPAGIPKSFKCLLHRVNAPILQHG
jgi:hypothetical protein